MRPWTLLSTLAFRYVVLGPCVPVLHNQLVLQVEPVLGFPASPGLEVQIPQPDLHTAGIVAWHLC